MYPLSQPIRAEHFQIIDESKSPGFGDIVDIGMVVKVNFNKLCCCINSGMTEINGKRTAYNR